MFLLLLVSISFTIFFTLFPSPGYPNSLSAYSLLPSCDDDDVMDAGLISGLSRCCNSLMADAGHVSMSGRP
eukprot:11736193-Karenia_brevis.AAC.1